MSQKLILGSGIQTAIAVIELANDLVREYPQLSFFEINKLVKESLESKPVLRAHPSHILRGRLCDG